MTLFVTVPGSYAVEGQTRFSFDIASSDTVLKLKEMIQEKTGFVLYFHARCGILSKIPTLSCQVEDQRPLYKGRQLNDNAKTLAELNIRTEDTLHLS
jgi:hypothetical protein